MTGPLNTVKIIVMSVIVYTYFTHSTNQRIEQRYEKASLPSFTFLALALLTIFYFLDNLIMTSRLYKQHFHLLQIWLQFWIKPKKVLNIYLTKLATYYTTLHRHSSLQTSQTFYTPFIFLPYNVQSLFQIAHHIQIFRSTFIALTTSNNYK